MSRRCVILTGMIGAGKTAVGELLADQLGYELVEVDDLVAEKAGKSVARLVSEDGEARLRELEKEAIAGLAGTISKVIAVGAGAPADPENRRVIGRLGHVVYLKASAQELYQRIKNDRERPVLHGDDPKAMIKDLLEQRDPDYRRATIVIDTEDLNVDEVVDALIDHMARLTIETEIIE